MQRQRDRFALSFLAPAGAPLGPVIGRFQHGAHACQLGIMPGGLIVIEGSSREAVTAHAGNFLRALLRGRPPACVDMVLRTPGRPGGYDSWVAIVNADVALVPTAVAPVIPALELVAERAQPPPLVIEHQEQGH